MELIVEKDYTRRSVKLFIETENGRERYLIGQENGKLVQQLVNPLEVSEAPFIPLLEMPINLFEDFLKSVVEYGNGVGVKTKDANLMQGILEAKESHLDHLKFNFDKLIDKLVQ